VVLVVNLDGNGNGPDLSRGERSRAAESVVRNIAEGGVGKGDGALPDVRKVTRIRTNCSKPSSRCLPRCLEISMSPLPSPSRSVEVHDHDHDAADDTHVGPSPSPSFP